MKAAAFEYVRADNLEHALGILDEAGAEAKLIAGGQSLVPMMAMRFARPSLLVDINRLEELKKISQDEQTIRIGACVRQRDIEFDHSLNQTAPLLKKALSWVGHSQTRNRGTIGGSLVYADPSAELPLASLILGASMHLQSDAGGLREVEAANFFLGPMFTAVSETECLLAIDLPIWHGKRIGSAFTEVSMRKGDFAMASAACQLQINDDETLRRISFGVGGVNSVPTIFPQIAQKMIGKHLTPELAQEIALMVAKECDPGSDTHVSSRFRRSLAETLLARVMLEAVEDSMHNGVNK